MKKKSESDSLEKEKERWEKSAAASETEKRFANLSGMEIEALYTPLDLKDFDYRKELGFPGEFPFTRGVHKTMYRERPWTMRQFAGLGTAEETNRRFKYLLERGQMGLSVAFDLPTLMGCDSDHPMSHGEVGRCGVAIDSLEDMEILFDGIPMDKVTTSMTINAPAAVLFAMYLVAAEKRGIDFKELGGTIQNDILKEFIAQKEWIYPPEAHLKLIRDTIVYSTKNVPKWNPVSISGYHIREAGSTAVQELAFTLYDGLTYVEESIKAGLDIDEFAPRLSFFFNAHNDFFEEIAKFRAGRRIWAKEIKKRYGPRNPASLLLRFHTQTAGCTLTAEQPQNNIVRVAIQALAGVLGGTQSLHTDSMDETHSTPSEEAASVALRTQQIIAHETGVVNSIDPLGGSYYLESLTNRMEEEVYRYFGKLDGLGGMVAAIKEGFPQREIRKAAFDYQKEVDAKQRIIVGLNAFREKGKWRVPPLKLDPLGEEKQIERLEAVKRKRDGRAVARALDNLKKTAEQDENLMPPMMEAVSVYATVGEICDTLKEVYGSYGEPGLPAETPAPRTGARKLLICKAGQDGHDRGVMVLANFLADNGYQVIYSGLRKTPDSIVALAVREKVDLIGLSILSGAHNTWFPRILELLRKKGRENIRLIGGGIMPEEDIRKLEKLGVGKIFTAGSPLEEILEYIDSLFTHKP